MNFKRKKRSKKADAVVCSYCVPSVGLYKEKLRVAKEQIDETIFDPMKNYFKWREDEVMDGVATQFGMDEWDQIKRHEHL